MRKHRPAGFTMVELMVVILIVGMLMALLVMAVQSSRESARKSQCLHRMRGIAIAINQYEATANHYPGFRHYPYHAIALGTNQRIAYATGWFPPLFDLLGLGQLAAPDLKFGWKQPQVIGTESFSYAPPLHPKLVCPSDFEKMGYSQYPLTSFVVNSGRPDSTTPTKAWPSDWRSNGIFVDLLPHRGNRNNTVKTWRGAESMSASFVGKYDGLSMTLMLTENLQATAWYSAQEPSNSFVFVDPADVSGKVINGPGFDAAKFGNYATARPSSNHNGGVNVVFADESGRFLRDDIDYDVYCALMTSNGKAAREPGRITPSASAIINPPQIALDDL